MTTHSQTISGKGALVTGSYAPRLCGIADHNRLLVKSLARIGAPLDVWTRADPETAWNAASVNALFDRLRHSRPALVHLQYEAGIWDDNPRICLLPLIARRLGLQVVVTVHALNGLRALLPLLLLPAHDVVVCSDRQYNSLRSLGPLRDRVHLIPVGSNLPRVTTPKLLRLPLRLVYFGFLWPGRNIEWCIRAAIRANAITPTELFIVGGIKDQNYANFLSLVVRQERARDVVKIVGAVGAQEAAKYLSLADIALLPFESGASPGRTTLMSALQHGVCVVTTGRERDLAFRLGAGTNSIDTKQYEQTEPDAWRGRANPLTGFCHGQNMLIAPLTTSDDLNRDNFCRFVESAARDDELRTNIARAGRELYTQRFTWPRIAGQVCALPSYQKVFGEP